MELCISCMFLPASQFYIRLDSQDDSFSTVLLLRVGTRSGVGVRNRRARAITASASSRPNYFPGSTPPKHLDGSLPGDYGFDPLGLGRSLSHDTSLSALLFPSAFHGRLPLLGLGGLQQRPHVHSPSVRFLPIVSSSRLAYYETLARTATF